MSFYNLNSHIFPDNINYRLPYTATLYITPSLDAAKRWIDNKTAKK